MDRIYRVFSLQWMPAAIAVVCLAAVLTLPARADDHLPETKRHETQSRDTFFPIAFFQKVLSRADGDRCPMHPSCSHYANTAIQKYGLLKGWVLACDRLLRCGRDEVRLATPILVNGRRLVHDPLSANTFWWEHP